MINTNDITGLILAGGQGSRMGGVDKGLQHYQGIPMALHAVTRLSSQVGKVVINANRNLSTYQSMGATVYPDDLPGFEGPLAGLAAGLERCDTPYLVSVPCDCPLFPLDFVQRLADALQNHHADIAMAATKEQGKLRTQPVFCLLKTSLLASLRNYLHSGQRKVETWTAQHHCVTVLFDDARAFAGANTLTELQQLSL
jgi:molybdopterin-guanine dinucleotide biosynthesis protein A